MMRATKQRDDSRRQSPVLRRKTATPSPRLADSHGFHPAISARLRIGKNNDRFEKEANDVAKRVTRMPQHHVGVAGDLREMRGASASRTGHEFEFRSGRGRPMPQTLRDFFEPKFGCDFSHVRIHTDEQSGELAEVIQARAFAVGSDIYFGAGEFSPETGRGQELLAHELTHVVQQDRSPPQSSPGPVRRQPETESPEFPDFPNLALKLEDDIGQNLFDYGHHFYRLATLFPDRPQLLQEAFGRYALGANVLETGFRFLGLDKSAASRLALGSGILFKGLNFAANGELVLDFQFDIGRGLKLETSLDLGVNPNDKTQIRKADVGIGIVRHF